MSSALPAALSTDGQPLGGPLQIYLSWAMIGQWPQKTLCLRFNAKITDKPLSISAYTLALAPDSFALTTRVGQAMLSVLKADLTNSIGLSSDHAFVTPLWAALYADKHEYARLEDRVLQALTAKGIEYVLVDIFGRPIHGWRAQRLQAKRLRAARRLKH